MDGYLLLGEGAGERGLLGVGDAARAEPLPLRHVAAHNSTALESRIDRQSNDQLMKWF